MGREGTEMLPREGRIGMDIEGYIIESGMLSLLGGGLVGWGRGLFPQVNIRKAGKCGAFRGRTRGFVWLEQEEYVETRFNNAEMGTIQKIFLKHLLCARHHPKHKIQW